MDRATFNKATWIELHRWSSRTTTDPRLKTDERVQTRPEQTAISYRGKGQVYSRKRAEIGINE